MIRIFQEMTMSYGDDPKTEVKAVADQGMTGPTPLPLLA